MRARGPIGSLLLAIVSTAASLAAVELWFRSHYGGPTALYRADPVVGWVHAPNLHREWGNEDGPLVLETDARGLRPPFHATPTGRPRVLILGDSFADGLDVASDRHFATLLQSRRPDLEIVNAGVSGYSTLQELLLARRLEQETRSAAWVVLVYDNDVHDNVTPFFPLLGPRPWIDGDGRERPVDWDIFAATLPPVPFAGWLHWHSIAVFQWEVARSNRLDRREKARYLMQWANQLSMKQRFALQEHLLGVLAQERPLLMVSCPPREDVRSGNRALAVVLHDVAAHLEVPFLDLQPHLQVTDYWQRNIHWNDEGHRVVATALAPALEPLVPSPRAGAAD